jgi:hypothetical protein
MIDALRTMIARGFRRLALPLAAYYVVTLAVPFANGAARSGMVFVEHALVVIVVPPIVIVLACAVAQLFRSARGFVEILGWSLPRRGIR